MRGVQGTAGRGVSGDGCWRPSSGGMRLPLPPCRALHCCAAVSFEAKHTHIHMHTWMTVCPYTSQFLMVREAPLHAPTRPQPPRPPSVQFGTFGEVSQVNWVHLQYEVRRWLLHHWGGGCSMGVVGAAHLRRARDRLLCPTCYGHVSSTVHSRPALPLPSAPSHPCNAHRTRTTPLPCHWRAAEQACSAACAAAVGGAAVSVCDCGSQAAGGVAPAGSGAVHSGGRHRPAHRHALPAAARHAAIRH